MARKKIFEGQIRDHYDILEIEEKIESGGGLSDEERAAWMTWRKERELRQFDRHLDEMKNGINPTMTFSQCQAYLKSMQPARNLTLKNIRLWREFLLQIREQKQ